MFCLSKPFTVEMHHMRVDFANPGDNVGLNIKGLDKGNMPRSGDVMVYKKATLVTGETKKVKTQLSLLKGSWNKALAGWIFPAGSKDAVLELLRQDPTNQVEDDFDEAEAEAGAGASQTDAEAAPVKKKAKKEKKRKVLDDDEDEGLAL